MPHARRPLISGGLSLAVIAFLPPALMSVPVAAAPITLVAAPSAGGSYYGMYCVSCTGTSFTLASSADVATIAVSLFTTAGTNFTQFDFSLLSSATTTIATATLTAPAGATSTETMNVNQILPAGTYYLVGNVPGYYGTTVTPGYVDGWFLSTGVYDNAYGTAADGVGSFVGNVWTVYDPSPGYYAPAFTVSGTPVTTLSGFQGGTGSAPVLITAPLVGEITGTIGGFGSEEYYGFYWAGGAFSATGSVTGAGSNASYLFSEGTVGSCSSSGTATLNSGDGFTGTIGIANLPAGEYCIGLDANNANDPNFTLTFNTPVQGTVTPEPSGLGLLLGGLGTIGALGLMRRRAWPHAQ